MFDNYYSARAARAGVKWKGLVFIYMYIYVYICVYIYISISDECHVFMFHQAITSLVLQLFATDSSSRLATFADELSAFRILRTLIVV